MLNILFGSSCLVAVKAISFGAEEHAYDSICSL